MIGRCWWLAVALLLTVDVGCARPSVERTEWVAMGTVAAIQSRGADPAAMAAVREGVQARYLGLVRLLNAHDPGSELSRLASLTDAEVLLRCDDDVRECYAAAFRLRDLTGGVFSPRWRGVGTLDLGAIAKGFAVDVAAAEMPAEGADWLLDLGGNLKSVRGVWRVGVSGGDGRGVVATVELSPGEALATSATYFRGAHIADGRDGRPVTGAVKAVTVLASSAMWADAFSTTFFILGPEAGRRIIDELREIRERVLAVKWQLDDGSQVDFDPSHRFSK